MTNLQEASKRFTLYSGNRLVAHGVKFPNGKYVISLHEPNEIRIYDDEQTFERVYSLGNLVFVTWLDEDEDTQE